MASGSHVLLRSVLEFEEEEAQLRFDEASRRLVLIKHRQFLGLRLRHPAPVNNGMEQSSGATSGAASSSDGAASACVRSDAPHAQPIVCENQGKVGEVRYSLNHRFAAVQRSETTVELLDLLLHNSFELAARGAGAKARWRILGFRWTGTPVSDFVVVTSAGVELYLVLPERKSVRLVKTIATDVSWYVYSHETRLFLLASGAQDNSLLGLQVQPQTVVKMPRFEVQLAPVSAALGQPAGQQRLRPSLQPSQLAVVRLYDSLFAAHVEPERQTLSLYQLFKDFVVRKHTLQVYSSQVSVSVSDNLLLVHALDSRVVLLFDIKINTQFPVTAPLPLSTAPSDGFSASYAAHWVFAAPDLVIDPVAGRVGQLCVDLYALARSSLDKFCLLQFLLARSNAQGVILEVLRCAIDEQESLPVLSRMFELLCAVEAQRKEAQSPTPVQRGAPRPRAGSARAASVIFQHGAGEAANASYRAGWAYGDSFRAVAPVGALESCESATRITSSSPPPWIEGLSDDADYDSAPPTGAMIGKYVLRPAVDAVMSTQPPSDARCVRRRFVVAALTELLFCMQQHALPPDEDVVSMLVEMLVSQGTVFQLLQLIECGVVPESAATVAQLLSYSSTWPEAEVAALDMLERLGESEETHDAVMRLLLKQGKLLSCCRFIRQHRLFAYPPRTVLAAAAASDDRLLFRAVYLFFLQRNEVWRGSADFIVAEDCEEFTALFQQRESTEAAAARGL